jgi:hypothetical protein
VHPQENMCCYVPFGKNSRRHNRYIFSQRYFPIQNDHYHLRFSGQEDDDDYDYYDQDQNKAEIASILQGSLSSWTNSTRITTRHCNTLQQRPIPKHQTEPKVNKSFYNFHRRDLVYDDIIPHCHDSIGSMKIKAIAEAEVDPENTKPMLVSATSRNTSSSSSSSSSSNSYTERNNTNNTHDNNSHNNCANHSLPRPPSVTDYSVDPIITSRSTVSSVYYNGTMLPTTTTITGTSDVDDDDNYYRTIMQSPSFMTTTEEKTEDEDEEDHFSSASSETTSVFENLEEDEYYDDIECVDGIIVIPIEDINQIDDTYQTVPNSHHRIVYEV